MEREPECDVCLDSGEFFVIFDEDTGDGAWLRCEHGADTFDLMVMGAKDE